MSTIKVTVDGGDYEVTSDDYGAPVLASIDGILAIGTGYGTYGRSGGVDAVHSFAAAVQDWADAYEAWADQQEPGS